MTYHCIATSIFDVDFSPYGAILMPTDNGKRRDNSCLITNLRPHAQTNVAQIRATSIAGLATLTVDMMERHPYSSQTFFPSKVKEYLIAVCDKKTDGSPDSETLKALIVPGTIGIHYLPDVWHIGISVLSGEGEFSMLIHEDGTSNDCIFTSVTPINVALPRS
jgi:ureidoglycolate lyase